MDRACDCMYTGIRAVGWSTSLLREKERRRVDIELVISGLGVSVLCLEFKVEC